MTSFDLPGALRRIRRLADLSQRELAQQLGASKSRIAAAESGAGGLDIRLVAQAAGLCDLRLVLLDKQGTEVAGMDPDGVRDLGYRRFPAHLDTRYSDVDWYPPLRYDRPEAWYTFTRDRQARDRWRERTGTPSDHQLPQPGDSPRDRRAARARAARDKQRKELQRRREAGEFTEPPPFVCTCPPECEELDQGERPVHAAHCVCGCDVG